MLCLTRRIGEALLIEGGIEVKVVGIVGHKVTLGVTAPPTVQIMREEICHANIRRALAAAPAVAGVLPHRPGAAGRLPDLAA